jgi:N-acetyl-gamma-glutamyl-phosphate reductase
MHTVSGPEASSSGTAAAAGAVTRVAIAGATGFTGQELLRLLARHPHVSLVAATSSGATAGRRLPGLGRIWDGTIRPLDAAALAAEADLVFLALPDTAAAELAPRLADAGVRVIDLSGALRLHDAALRARWYPETRALPDHLAYGLTEHARAAVASARVVANPGCYPTVSLLALKPLADAGLLLPQADVIIDAKSGVSGAGKTPTERTHFSEVHGSLSAYGVLGHRHGAEIEERFGGPVTFTPHLLPLDRGILATIYVRVAPGTTEEAIGTVYDAAYSSEVFVRVVGPELPAIKHVVHTNFCDIGWRVDPSGRVVIVAVIDNLLKGASGQAVQNMNVMIGVPETAGLL